MLNGAERVRRSVLELGCDAQGCGCEKTQTKNKWQYVNDRLC